MRDHDLVLVVDFGSRTAQVIARRVREQQVYSRVVSPHTPVRELLDQGPAAVIVTGQAAALSADGVAEWFAELAASQLPILTLGGAAADGHPWAAQISASSSWDPHDGTPAAVEPLQAFLFDIAACEPTWTPPRIAAGLIDQIRSQVGSGHAICGLSGGVDSAVAAALVQRAIGAQLTCVFVDHGLLRKNEAIQVERDFVAATGVTLEVVDASERFFAALAGVTDPEQKRRIIGHEFIGVFEDVQSRIQAHHPVDFLVQGTLYPDVVESEITAAGVSVKSHHNVGGLPDELTFDLIEPLRDLFKDEVRLVGEELGLPADIVWRHPFPGPGLGIRIVGEVTPERVAMLQAADSIAQAELQAAGLEAQVWQFPVVLLADVRSVGVLEGQRTYGHPVVLRPVASEDAMTAQWVALPAQLLQRISHRITHEVAGINRVVLDITNKPPGTIEWE